jgi:hypothetical protein
MGIDQDGKDKPLACGADFESISLFALESFSGRFSQHRHRDFEQSITEKRWPPARRPVKRPGDAKNLQNRIYGIICPRAENGEFFAIISCLLTCTRSRSSSAHTPTGKEVENERPVDESH